MKLKKELGLLDVFSLASGSMISSGLFVLPAIAFMKTGASVILGYCLAGFFIIPALLSKAELATAMPKTGGSYFFIDRSMGSAFGTVAGIASWLSLGLKSAFALIGIGTFALLFYPELTIFQLKSIAVLFTLIFMVINILGAKHSGKFQIYLVFGLILLLIIFIIKGFPFINYKNYSPFIKFGYRELLATAGLIFISYGGLTKVAAVAGEIKNPSKNLPLGMILSFIFVTLLYIMTVFIVVGVLGENLIIDSKPVLTPISDTAANFSGRKLELLLALAALFAFISTANAGILSASRIPVAMSRDNILPSFFKIISYKFGTPIISIIITSSFMIFAIVVLDLESLVKTASTLMLLLLAFDNLSVILMRESKLQNYRPTFKAPLYPFLQIISIVVYSILILDMGFMPILISSIFIIISLLWYYFYGNLNIKKESALILLIERLTDKRLSSGLLSNELKDILIERDEVKKDWFHKIIEKTLFFDIDNTSFFKNDIITKDDLFKFAAEIIEKKYSLDKESIYNLFIKRETESSTIVTDYLAIPHIVLEGEEKFSILIFRSKKGIVFNDKYKHIEAVFILSGTRDNKQYHLQALTAFAQIIQNSNFRKLWVSANNTDELKHIILLATRHRFI